MAALTFALARLGEAEETSALGQDMAVRGRRVLGPGYLATRLAAQIAGVGSSLTVGDDPSVGLPKSP